MKHQKEIEKIYILDITNAIMPKNWPNNIPKMIEVTNGKYGKDFDIIPKKEEWYQNLLKFIKNKNELPIGLNKNRLPIGSNILLDNKIIYSGKNKEVYLNNLKLEKEEKEKKLIPLREKYIGVKDEFLLDYNETINLLSSYRPFKEIQTVYDVFNDIFLSGGGSIYQDKKIAALGAYNSTIDFKVLKTTLSLFNLEEKKLLKTAFSSIVNFSPIFSLIHGQINIKENELTPEVKKFKI